MCIRCKCAELADVIAIAGISLGGSALEGDWPAYYETLSKLAGAAQSAKEALETTGFKNRDERHGAGLLPPQKRSNA